MAQILAPIGRDAEAIHDVVRETELSSCINHTLTELVEKLSVDTRMVIATEEGFRGDIAPLEAWVNNQPSWSDLPIIILSTAHNKDSRTFISRWKSYQRLGNVTILERPLQPESLLLAVGAAQRARARQFDMRRYLEKINASKVELEDRVERRDQALRDAQKLEALGRLTGGVAHDFNNLLQVIRGGIDVMNITDEPARRRIMLNAMSSSCTRATKLIQQLMAFARRQPLAAETIDLKSSIIGMEEVLRASLRTSIELEFDLVVDLWPIRADITQLSVALLNLVVNAKDALEDTKAGKVTITARNAVLKDEFPELPPGEYVMLCVTDNGMGMDENTADHAFEPFFTTKPMGGGTGMGLSQVHGFARQSNGSVRIHSKAGEGTTVSLALPRSRERVLAKIMPTSSSTKSAVRGRILFIEDDQTVADITRELLISGGFMVDHVCTADAAIECRLSDYTLVLSDVIMPGKMDGVALAIRLRSIMPTLPVILMSGYAGSPDRVTKTGFTLLNKPISREELFAAIGNALRTQQETVNSCT